MAKILIKNGRVWDGEKFFFADVLTKDGKIAKVEKEISEQADFVFDATDKIVSPGLVDIHVHMLGLNEEFGIHPELSCIPFGVTAAVDGCGVLGDKALLDSFLLKNRVFVSALFENNRADFSLAEKKLKDYGEKAVGIKVYFDTELNRIEDTKPLCQVVDYAEKRGLKVMVHSSNPPVSMGELISVLRKGDILTHAYHGGKNTVADDGFECIFEAKKRGVVIDAGMAGHIHTDFKVFENAIKCGAIPDVISTDITRFSAYKRGGRYGMTMCMSIAKHLGMSEEDIFRTVTSAPAKALGMENQWGKLEGCADIAVFEYADEGFDLTDKAGNNIKSTKGYRCVMTISNGDVVYKR